MPGLDNATAHANKIVSRCKLLASFSEDPAAIRRMFLCPAMRDCHREISRWLNAAGAKVSVDAAGNLHGFYAGAEASAPRLLIGSHLDTIPNAGAYDGVLGVVLAVALLESPGSGDSCLLRSRSSDFPRRKAYASALRSSAAARWSDGLTKNC